MDKASQTLCLAASFKEMNKSVWGKSSREPLASFLSSSPFFCVFSAALQMWVEGLHLKVKQPAHNQKGTELEK